MNAIKMTIIMLAMSIGLSANKPFGADDIIGTWLTASKDAKVTIFKTGNYFYGKISWMREPLDEKGRPKTDINNRDESVQGKPVMNLLILKSFEYNAMDDLWQNGTIYDPKNGKTYSCKLELANSNTLEVRGYIGISLVGRTETWVKQD
jgi:uncharacterized protein (DUF2147 family)